MRCFTMAAAAVSLAALSVFAQSVPPSASTPSEAASPFLGQLARATERGDRQALAALMRFPIVVTMGGLRLPIDDARTFGERYDAIFTPELKEAIARAARAASDRAVSVTSGRLAIGADLVVARAVNGSWAVVEIHVPPSRSGDASVGAPRRISVRAGPSPTQMAGALAGGAADAYLVRGVKGQLLEVRIEGVQGRDVVARVFEASSGNSLDARTKDGVRTWSGRLTADGDYRIDVVRLKPGDDTLPYTLSVRTR